MTADLVARLEADANEIVADWHRSMGLPLPDTGAVRQRVDLLREAASALRSSGEAVYQIDRGDGYEEIGKREFEEYQQFNVEHPDYYDIRVLYTTQPTPASTWRPISEAPRGGRGFLVYLPEERRSIQTAWQNKNGVMAIGSCFSFDLTPVTHWMPLPAPPTSTEGG